MQSAEQIGEVLVLESAANMAVRNLNTAEEAKMGSARLEEAKEKGQATPKTDEKEKGSARGQP